LPKPSYSRAIHLESTDEQPGAERSVLHRAPVEQGHKGTHVLDRAQSPPPRSFDHSGFQIPENSRGFALPQRQETLACGNKSGDGLVKIAKRGSVFIEMQRAARKTESRSMMNQIAVSMRRLPEIFEDILEVRKVSEPIHGREKIAAQCGASCAGFARRLECAQQAIQLPPPLRRERFAIGSPEAKPRPAKDSFHYTRFLKVCSEKFREVAHMQPFVRDERFDSEGVRESANRESAICKMEKLQFGKIAGRKRFGAKRIGISFHQVTFR